MLTACKHRNQTSKPVILSIGSRLKGNAFDLPVPCEIGHGAEPSSFMFLRGTFAFCRRERSGDGPKFRIHQTDCRSGIAQNSCRARFDAHSWRNGKFESTSRLCEPGSAGDCREPVRAGGYRLIAGGGEDADVLTFCFPVPRKKQVEERGQVIDHTAQARRARPAEGRRGIASRPLVSKSIGRQQVKSTHSAIEDSSPQC